MDAVEEIRQWALKARIPLVQLDALLKFLRRTKFPMLPKSSKTFRRTSSTTYDIKKFDDDDESEFVYFGISEYLRRTINGKLHTDRNISLLINVDGSSPYKGSLKQLWPILFQALTDKLLKQRQLPPKSWKKYRVHIRGGASKYNHVKANIQPQDSLKFQEPTL